MLVDVKRLFSAVNASQLFESSEDVSAEDFDGYTVPEPVSIALQAQRDGEKLLLTVTVSACVCAQCARCTEDIQRKVQYQEEARFSIDDLLQPDPEWPVTEAGKLDLHELAYTELVLNVPRVLLCSADCQGLCPVCGKPKAAGCGCVTAQTDERLAILKQLLS